MIDSSNRNQRGRFLFLFRRILPSLHTKCYQTWESCSIRIRIRIRSCSEAPASERFMYNACLFELHATCQLVGIYPSRVWKDQSHSIIDKSRIHISWPRGAYIYIYTFQGMNHEQRAALSRRTNKPCPSNKKQRVHSAASGVVQENQHAWGLISQCPSNKKTTSAQPRSQEQITMAI